MNSKGQIFTTDLLVALTVFLFILTLTVIFSGQVANRVEFWEQGNERIETALLVSRAIVWSSGEPSNWEKLPLTEITSIGLAEEKNVLSESKVERLIALGASDYDEAKELLGTAKYGTRITITDTSDFLLYEFGSEPSGENAVSSFTRVAMIDSTVVLIKLKVFE